MLHDELEDWFGPLRDDIEELNAQDFQELDQLNQIELHSLDVPISEDIYLLSTYSRISWYVATSETVEDCDNLRANFNAYSHFLFLCSFLWSNPFFKNIIPASYRLPTEKPSLSVSFSFYYHISREF